MQNLKPTKVFNQQDHQQVPRSLICTSIYLWDTLREKFETERISLLKSKRESCTNYFPLELVDKILGKGLDRKLSLVLTFVTLYYSFSILPYRDDTTWVNDIFTSAKHV